MEMTRKKDYLSRLLRDVQKARSVYYESNGNSEVAERVGAGLEPWLFGDNCILPALVKSIDGEPDDTAIVNFSHIATHSQMLRIIAIQSKRKDPTFEEIFEP